MRNSSVILRSCAKKEILRMSRNRTAQALVLLLVPLPCGFARCTPDAQATTLFHARKQGNIEELHHSDDDHLPGTPTSRLCPCPYSLHPALHCTVGSRKSSYP
ncbi:hypothetical protein C8R45DRAFT_955070 [Mycena sanguinolenta]|nr:hypothetical protein C8R45DRAFT_955070 [Mycena sanguinolenta]